MSNRFDDFHFVVGVADAFLLLGTKDDADGAVLLRLFDGGHGAREDHIAGFQAGGGVEAIAVLYDFSHGGEGLLIEKGGGLFDLLAGDELLVFDHTRDQARVAEQHTDTYWRHADGGRDGVVGETIGLEERNTIVARGELFDGDTGNVHSSSLLIFTI